MKVPRAYLGQKEWDKHTSAQQLNPAVEAARGDNSAKPNGFQTVHLCVKVTLMYFDISAVFYQG